MKLNKTSIILLSILLLCAIIIAGILFWFFSPGVHHILNYAHLDTSTTGYVFNKDRELVQEATFSVKVTAAPSDGRNTAEKNTVSLLEITGFAVITSNDVISMYTHELKNDILMVNIVKPGAYKQTDGTFAPTRGNEYRIFIDKKTSEILMCIIHISNDDEKGTYDEYYFIPSNDTKSITDTLNRAYID